MNEAIKQMLIPYNAKNSEEEENAIKEILQEIVLCGLSRADFFNKAAFYGGTALRIFYGLDRFSEDLDFSLIAKDENFNLSDYIPELIKEVNSYGINVEISSKEKNADSAIQSAFLKANTMEHLLLFYADNEAGIDPKKSIKVKFEIDTNPPDYATFEHRYRLLPAPYGITLYDTPSLFAGKIDAILNRKWGQRVKGRDYYDYVFYLSRNCKVNLKHLDARMKQRGLAPKNEYYSLEEVKELLFNRFEEVDFEEAKKDVLPFIKDARSVNLWSEDFFRQITKALKI